MKKPNKSKKRIVFESFVLVQNENTWIKISGDGFLLEDEMFKMRGMYPDRKYKIHSCHIVLKD